MHQLIIYVHYLFFLLYMLLKIIIQISLFIIQPFFAAVKIICSFLPQKCLKKDKQKHIVYDKIEKCQEMLDKFLQKNNAVKRYKIKWIPSNNAPNAHAASCKKIILTGDWSFLENDVICIDNKKYETLDYLYLTVGHELGHKDSELFPSIFTNIQNYIREIRADFCGIEFAVFCQVERKLAIETKYDLSEYFDIKYGINKIGTFNSYLDGHPTNLHRKEYLDNNTFFSEDVINSIIVDFYKDAALAFCKTPLCNKIKRKALTFSVFH